MKTIIEWFIDKTQRKLRVRRNSDGSIAFVYGFRGQPFDSWLSKRGKKGE